MPFRSVPTIDGLRETGATIVVALMLAGTVAACLTALMIGNGNALPTLLVALAATAHPTWNLYRNRQDGTSRIILGLSAPIIPSAFLIALSGHPWQIDGHMIFYAYLAALAILCDWRPILAGAATTAMHHLILSFVLPTLVFGEQGSVARVAFHATIVLVETGILMWTTNMLALLLHRSAGALDAAADVAIRLDEQNKLTEHQNSARAGVLTQVTHGLNALATGNLTIRINTPFPEEFEPLRADFNATAAGLEQTMAELINAMDAISATIGQLGGASDDLAYRTDRQAEDVAQTLVAAQETSDEADRIATRTEEGQKLFSAALVEAERARSILLEATGAMTTVTRSSDAINSVIAIIEDIANNTSQLALNAGIEAARSGDAGRGFAVVASEVRQLAVQAKQSAARVKLLVEQSAGEIAQSARLVGATGTTVRSMVDRFEDISALIAEIAESTARQTRTLSTMRAVMSSFSDATRRNAAMAEQSNGIAQALATEAARLTALTGQFDFSRAQTSGDIPLVATEG